MLVALAVPLVAVAVGTLLALAGGASPRVLVPVRSFALAAVLVAVVTHLLPEAIADGGPWTLAVFAAGVAAPLLVGRLGARATRHARLATELGFLGVVLHQVGDGFALGALSGHWDVVLAIGVHTVPLAAAVALGMVGLHGRRGAIIRAAILFLATAAGVVATAAGGEVIASGVSPWINAAVAGLLVHVLSHDLPTPARSRSAPVIEVLAIAAGVALPLVAGGGHSEEHVDLIGAMREILALIAVPLALGLVAAIAIDVVGARARRALLRLRSPVAGIAAAALSSSCSCRVVRTARVRTDDVRPAALIAFVLVAPELGLDTVLLGTQLFGVPAMLIRLAAAIAIALVAGAIAGRVAIPPPPTAAVSHDHEHGHDHEHAGGHDDAHADHPHRSLLDCIDEVIIHSGPWLAIGLVVAALALVGLPDGALAGSRWLALGAALVLAAPAYVCAPAATPFAAVLILRGLPPGAAIAGLVFGAASNRAGLALLARAYGAGAMLAAAGVALVIATAAGVAVELAGVGGPGEPPLAYDGPLVTAAMVVLGAAVVRGLWRYGLAAWLEPLHDADHRHHQHADGAPCVEGCHDH